MSDLASIDKAINQLMGYAVTSSIFGGQPNTIYISIPDASSTCANLGLPSLPSGWSYSCSTQSNYRNINGTGWIPINFAALSIGSPISNLPIDPINQTSTSQYYTYVTGGSYELTATLESEKYGDKSTNDGGIDPATLEIGSDLKLSPFTHGLVGYWNFDETGTTVFDKSGFANNGTMFSSTTITDLHLASTTCKTGNRCAQFDGVDDYANVSSIINLGPNWAILAWFKTSSFLTRPIISNRLAGSGAEIYFGITAGVPYLVQNECSPSSLAGVFDITDNVFHLYAFVRRSSGVGDIYIDGKLIDSNKPVLCASFAARPWHIAHDIANGTEYFSGLIDNVEIYNRALSASQIKAIYNATK